MFKFFFHIRDGKQLIRDEEGLALDDWSQIHTEAQKSAWDIAAERGCHSMRCSIEVTDQFGEIVDRIRIEPPPKSLC